MKRFAVFAVMPFSDDFRDIYDLGIKGACTEAGVVCERVDEQSFLEAIPERIYGQIESADVIVAEVSESKPNVFYEVGYAHGIGKQVILLARKSAELHFDLRHYPHIIYNRDRIRELKAELSKKVLWCKDNPDQLKFRKNAEPLKDQLDSIEEQIANYLKANRYTKVSFERIEQLMHIPEEQVRKLIASRSERFRFAFIKDKKTGESKAGIGFTAAPDD